MKITVVEVKKEGPPPLSSCFDAGLYVDLVLWMETRRHALALSRCIL
jgi:hypothetical protein